MTAEPLRVLITGASSGIGREIAIALAGSGAVVALCGRHAERLAETVEAVRRAGGQAAGLVADLARPDDLERTVREASAWLGNIDVLVNNAGANSFGSFEHLTTEQEETLWRINVLVPLQLTRHLLPAFRKQRAGHIVNVGSIFGSIGFPWFVEYSATKFAVRGFSEALRRELDGTGVQVTYVAPRGTRTPMAASFVRMADAVGLTLDDPADVAAAVARAIHGKDKDRYLGFPERLLVKVNAVLPRLVDRILAGQKTAMEPFALEDVPAEQSSPTHPSIARSLPGASRVVPTSTGVSS